MSINKKNNNNNKSLSEINKFNNSTSFSIVSSDYVSVLYLNPLKLVHLGDFIVAFMRHHKIRINKSNQKLILQKFLTFYISLSCSYDSSFVTWLFNSNIYLSCPSFVHVHLLKIVAMVKTVNKLSGFTSGSINQTHTFSNMVKSFEHMSFEDFKTALLITEFSSVITTESDFIHFRRETLEYINNLRKGKTDFETIVSGFLLPSTMVYDFSKFPIFNGFIEFSISSLLGVHRFRSSSVVDHYYTNQYSLTSLSLLTVEMYCQFLYIFKPVVSINNGSPIIDGPSGDVIIDVSCVPLSESWFAYINVTSTDQVKPTKKKFSSNTTSIPKSQQIESIGDLPTNISGLTQVSICAGIGTGGREVFIPVYRLSDIPKSTVFFNLSSVPKSFLAELLCESTNRYITDG